jgi:hypothetical protein
LSTKSLLRPLAVAALTGLAVAGVASADRDDADGPVTQAKRVHVKTGKWTGTAVDDVHGIAGTISFTIAKDGRQLRNLRMNDMAGDCPEGASDPSLNVQVPTAKIKPSGLMRGHYVGGKPGDAFLSVTSYDARFRARRVTGARIYDDSDIDADRCDVSAATFSATHQGG